jgi:hypothetical protein
MGADRIRHIPASTLSLWTAISIPFIRHGFAKEQNLDLGAADTMHLVTAC